MTDIVNSKRTNFKKDNKKDKDMARKEVKSVYSRCLNTIKVSLPIQSVGNNLTQNLENYIKFMVEGKCIVEGFVKRDSVRIITNSSGLLLGDKVRFEVVYECLVCFPVSGMLLNCIAKLKSILFFYLGFSRIFFFKSKSIWHYASFTSCIR